MENRIDLTLMALIGWLGRCDLGAKQGGILVVVGHPQGAVLPPVNEDSWIEYGPRQEYDRIPFHVWADTAIKWVEEGWLEEGSRHYASVHYRLTEKAWKFYTEFEKWVKQHS